MLKSVLERFIKFNILNYISWVNMKEKEKSERKENSERDRDEKAPGTMKKLFEKLKIRPLTEKVLTVAVAATVSVACTTQFVAGDKDSEHEDVADIHDGHESIDGDVGVDMPEDSIPEDSISDAIEDADVEELETVCDITASSRTTSVNMGNHTVVGGAQIRYDAYEAPEGEYSILCNDIVVRRGIRIAEGETHVEDISEQAFSVELRVNLADELRTGLTITVTPY